MLFFYLMKLSPEEKNILRVKHDKMADRKNTNNTDTPVNAKTAAFHAIHR